MAEIFPVIFAVNDPATKNPTAFKAPATDDNTPAKTRSIVSVRALPTRMSIFWGLYLRVG
jgi:hypothetical protein